MKRTLILLSTLLGAACAPTLPRYQPLVMAELGEKLGGCDVGDLVPGGGDEVAVVSVSGALRVLEANGDAWSVIDAGRASGEMIQVAVGDVWPERGGDELIAVGMLAGDEESGGEGVREDQAEKLAHESVLRVARSTTRLSSRSSSRESLPALTSWVRRGVREPS